MQQNKTHKRPAPVLPAPNAIVQKIGPRAYAALVQSAGVFYNPDLDQLVTNISPPKPLFETSVECVLEDLPEASLQRELVSHVRNFLRAFPLHPNEPANVQERFKTILCDLYHMYHYGIVPDWGADKAAITRIIKTYDPTVALRLTIFDWVPNTAAPTAGRSVGLTHYITTLPHSNRTGIDVQPRERRPHTFRHIKLPRGTRTDREKDDAEHPLIRFDRGAYLDQQYYAPNVTTEIVTGAYASQHLHETYYNPNVYDAIRISIDDNNPAMMSLDTPLSLLHEIMSPNNAESFAISIQPLYLLVGSETAVPSTIWCVLYNDPTMHKVVRYSIRFNDSEKEMEIIRPVECTLGDILYHAYGILLDIRRLLEHASYRIRRIPPQEPSIGQALTASVRRWIYKRRFR